MFVPHVATRRRRTCMTTSSSLLTPPKDIDSVNSVGTRIAHSVRARRYPERISACRALVVGNVASTPARKFVSGPSSWHGVESHVCPSDVHA